MIATIDRQVCGYPQFNSYNNTGHWRQERNQKSASPYI